MHGHQGGEAGAGAGARRELRLERRGHGADGGADFFWEEEELLKGTICSLPPLSPLSPYPQLAFPQLFVS